jgi:hypothetical protein
MLMLLPIMAYIIGGSTRLTEGAMDPIKLTFLRGLAERIAEDANELKSKLEKEPNKVDLLGYRVEAIIDDHNTLIDTISCSSEFLNLHPLLSRISCDYLSGAFLPSQKAFQAVSDLERVARGCHALMDTLEVLLKPRAPPDTLAKLDLLRRELEKLEDKLEPGIIDDVSEAISEMEHGHNLAASLIASRVICYIFENIPGKSFEEKVNELAKREIIEKERKDEQRRFVWASKKARDILSHKAGLLPKSDEALQLVSSAVSFARYLAALSM